MDAALTGIQPQHDFAQAKKIPAALIFGFNCRTQVLPPTQLGQIPSQPSRVNASGQEVFSYRRKDVHENNFLIEHGCSMPRARWKVEYVTGVCDPLFITNCKEHPAALDQG